MPRRGKGEGNIRKRPDGRWEGRVTIGVTATGNPKTRSVYGKTREEAATKLNKLISQFNAGALTQNSNLTVNEFLDFYLERKHEKLDESTHTTYTNYFRAYVRPHIGGVRVAAITPLTVEQLLTTLKRAKKGPRVLEYTHTLLNAAMKQAIAWQLIERNPVAGVQKPAKVRTPKNVWDRQQARHFLNIIQGDRFYAAYLLFLTTGLRRSEVLGLKRDALDLPGLRLEVRHTIVYANGKQLARDKTKSATSRRAFRINQHLADAIAARLIEQDLERAVAGDRWVDTGYIFTDPEGRSLNEHRLRKHHDALIAKAEVPRLTFHELRHTYTSLALLKGISAKEVQRRLGHASITTTYDIYAHTYPEQDDAAALSADELLADDTVQPTEAEADQKEPEI
jgi:integrase